jgi:hypothetical protein
VVLDLQDVKLILQAVLTITWILHVISKFFSYSKEYENQNKERCFHISKSLLIRA